MSDALRFEWVRVRTIRSTYWLIGLAVVLAGVVASGVAAVTRSEVLEGGMAAAIMNGGSAFIPLPFPPVFMAILGILAVGHEYRHGTIQPTLEAMPQRSALVSAKLLVVAAVSAATAVVSLAVNGLLGTVIRGELLAVTTDEWWALLGYVVFVVLWGVLGAALALLMRSLPAAIVVILVTPLLVEPIVGALALSDSMAWLRDIVPYLPFSAGQQLPQATDLTGMAGGMEPDADMMVPLSRWSGGAVFAAFIAAVLAPAWVLFEKRDA